MEGITNDHEILTDNGWKYFKDIDIKKDKLYSLEYEEVSRNPYECYDYYTKFLEPLKKNSSHCSYDLYQIKNQNIDCIMTKNYYIPSAYVNQENRYDNVMNLYDIDTFYQLFREIKGNQERFDEVEIMLYSENDKVKIKNSDYDYDRNGFGNYLFKINLEDINHLGIQEKTIISFTMPRINEDTTYRIYVRRNGKEWWV